MTHAEVLKLDYRGFTIWLDCEHRGAINFYQKLGRDTGDYSRDSVFHFDKAVKPECQQKSTRTYGRDYDLGHQVSANSMDSDAESIHETNFITNILPQTKELNRGAWLQTEEIAQCYRAMNDLEIYGGAIWDEHSNFYFKTHSVFAPSFFYKVIWFDKYAVAWLFPNSHDAVGHDDIDKYLISVAGIEAKIKRSIPVPDSLKRLKPLKSWVLPKGCSLN